MTREVQASEAKTHLPRLLDEVERGETIIITRRGRRIARIEPDPERGQQEIDEAIDNITQFGNEIKKRNGKISIDEIISPIHAGHKY
jgi:prevent-host-death family protein